LLDPRHRGQIDDIVVVAASSGHAAWVGSRTTLVGSGALTLGDWSSLNPSPPTPEPRRLALDLAAAMMGEACAGSE